MIGRLSINKDKEVELRKAIQDNDGYCPCSVEKTDDTKCVCKEFKEQTVSGNCHCGLYYKTVKGSIELKEEKTQDNNCTINTKLTLLDAKLPLRSNPTDAGADLFSPVDILIKPHCSEFIDFGVQIEIPEGYAGFIYARSGLGGKFGIVPRNCVGVIDSKYRGNLGIMLENTGISMYVIKKGDRIAQLVIAPISTPEFIENELDMTDDRKSGFGGTGR